MSIEYTWQSRPNKVTLSDGSCSSESTYLDNGTRFDVPEYLLVDDQIFWGFQKLVTSVQCEVLASILSFLCLWWEFTSGLPVYQRLVARWRTELGLCRAVLKRLAWSW